MNGLGKKWCVRAFVSLLLLLLLGRALSSFYRGRLSTISFFFLFHLNFFHSVVNCEPSFRSCRSPVHSFIVRHNQKVSCDDSALLYGSAHG